MKIWIAGEYKYEAHYRVLARRVMAIAIVNKTVGDWAAYIDAVQGKDLDKEFEKLLEKKDSDKLYYNVAKVIFGWLDEKYTWRP